MNFLTPLAFLALPLLPLIVLFYMLKLKRQRKLVASTLLWRRAVEDLVANAPFQKLRNNLLMYLQLLIIAAMILALARPVMRLAMQRGTTLVLLVDQTASMQATDGGGMNRFERAKEHAYTLIEQMANNDNMTVIGFSNTSSIIQTATGDKALLRDAVRNMSVTDTEADLRFTSLIVESITTTPEGEEGSFRRPKGDAKTIILSDGGIGDVSQVFANVGTIEFVSVGEGSDNMGIVGMDVRESFTSVENLRENQVFVSIRNSFAEEKTATVELLLGTQSFDVREATISANSTGSVVFTAGADVSGIATARIVGMRDLLQIDDAAGAVIKPPREISILVVSTGNYFLEQALAADPSVQVRSVHPTDFEAIREEYDLTVFDNASTGSLGSGTYLFINSIPPNLGYEESGTEQNPQIIDWNRVHPVMRFVNMDRVLIGNAKKITAPTGTLALVESSETDLITVHETETRRVITVGFDIFKSYWPVDVSFPIFVSNVIDFSRRGGSESARAAYPTGATIPVLLPRGAASARVRMPDGREEPLEFAGSSVAYFSSTGTEGIYTALFDDGSTRDYAVNLMSELESTLTPAEEITLGGQTISGTESPAKSNQEVWPWLALLALGVLMVEWTVYCKRAWL